MGNQFSRRWGMVLLLLLAGCDQKRADSSLPAAPAPASVPALAAGAVMPAPVTPAAADTPAANATTLTSLVGPVALFPDPLLAQVLAASSQPDDIVPACAWLLQHKGLTGDALRRAVDAQTWSPAVKALSVFPDVLAQMAQNLPWTQALGAAYRHSPAAVMDAVQTLRQRATDNGSLKSTPQQTVTRTTGGGGDKASGAPAAVARQTITILPASPSVVYVPVYGSEVYGAPPVVYSTGYYGYSAGEMAATGLISFTAGVVLGAVVADSHQWNWGWPHWGMQWGAGPGVIYHHRPFVSPPVVFRPAPHRVAPYLAPVPHFPPLRGAPYGGSGERHPRPPVASHPVRVEPVRRAAVRPDTPAARQRAPGPVRDSVGQPLRHEAPLRISADRATPVLPARGALRPGLTAEPLTDGVLRRHRD